MCGRFTLSCPAGDIRKAFKLSDDDLSVPMPMRWNISPNQPVLAIKPRTIHSTNNHAFLARWGFIPEWATGIENITAKRQNLSHFEKPLFNARSETISSKPTFRNAFKHRRCIIPCTGFYEWDKKKRPHFISPIPYNKNLPLPLFSIAGIWETWLGADGTEIDTLAIITGQAHTSVTMIHKRMPIIIPQNHINDWLYGDINDARIFFENSHPMYAHMINTCVNNPENDTANLISPTKSNHYELF